MRCVFYGTEAVPLVEAVPSNVGGGGTKREPRRKLALRLIEQCCTNALPLRFGCNKKLIENAFFRNSRKKADNMSINDSDLQAPSICKTADNSAD